jgi:predicted phage terminase large subunit-like protein
MTFSAQYLQDPVPEGGNLVKWHWFRFHDSSPPRTSNDRIIVSWDTALSARELASFSACVVLQVRGETVWVLDVFRERLEYPDLKRKVIELHQRWRHAANDYALLIENKGSGMSLIQDLRGQNIHAVAVDPQGDKVMRMNQQTAHIEAGAVSLPKQAPWLGEFRRELMAFPAAHHTDQVDAFSQALNRVYNREGGEHSWGTLRY